MLPVDPMLAKLRRRRIWTILHLLLLPVGIILIVGGISNLSSFGREFFWSGLLSILAFTFIFFQERFLRRIEQRRQEAAFGDQMLLAAEQPAPDATALSLPITIKQGMSKLFVLTFVMDALIVDTLFGYPLMRNNPSIGSVIVICILVLITSIMFGVLVAMLYREFDQQIDVTGEGLTSRYKGKVSSICWSEVTLFATYGAFETQRSKIVGIYELSGANSVVRWKWYKYKRKNLLMSLGPIISLDEYNRQMQALLSLVAAKTGLPLYDLRKGKPGGGPKD